MFRVRDIDLLIVLGAQKILRICCTSTVDSLRSRFFLVPKGLIAAVAAIAAAAAAAADKSKNLTHEEGRPPYREGTHTQLVLYAANRRGCSPRPWIACSDAALAPSAGIRTTSPTPTCPSRFL